MNKNNYPYFLEHFTGQLPVGEAFAGDIVCASGLSGSHAGDGLGALSGKNNQKKKYAKYD